MAWMTEDQLRAFLMDRTLHAFHPETLERAATVSYRSDGTCVAEMMDGSRDPGRFGVSGDTYWTQYTRFRSGARHAFRLDPVGPDIAQAFHDDGARAYLQTPHATLQFDADTNRILPGAHT